MDRRTFSRSIAGGLALTVSGVSLNALAAVLGVAEDPVSESISCDGFRKLVGCRYDLPGNMAGQLELSEIEPASKTHPDHQFYLLFRKPEGAMLDEGIYRLVSQTRKPLTLMLSPIESRPEMMEAVINLQTFA